jgi:hypothetical protein
MVDCLILGLNTQVMVLKNSTSGLKILRIVSISDRLIQYLYFLIERIIATEKVFKEIIQ